MVANLPAEAKAKWSEVVACRFPPKKIKLMRDFMALVPKHKGTNKLLGNVRRRIAVLEQELEKSKAKRKGGRGGGFSLPKEGAGQIVILGLTNVGRSSLLAKVTNVKVESSAVPYATRNPIIGMLPYLDVQFQIIEAPALVEGSATGRMDGPQILGLVRNADGLILMVDLSRDPIKQLEIMDSELDQAGIMIKESDGEVEVTRRSGGSGVQISGGGILVDCTLDDVRRLLETYRVRSALVNVRGKVTLEDIQNSIFSSNIYKPTLVVANKVDMNGTLVNQSNLKKLLRTKGLSLLTISCVSDDGLEDLGRMVFEMLRVMRIYAKEPNTRKPSDKPIIVENGVTIMDVTKRLHSKLYKRFRYARIWGGSAKHPGQKVGPNHVLKDGDVIEIH